MKLMVLGITAATLIFLGILVGIFYGAFDSTNKDQSDTCQEFCNCSVTKDCPYTFDYSKVKHCECGD